MGRIVKNTALLDIEHNSKIEEVTQWVKEHCPSFISVHEYFEYPRPYMSSIMYNHIRFYFLFSDENDLTWFTLKWG
jgi:hypothetical protein